MSGFQVKIPQVQMPAFKQPGYGQQAFVPYGGPTNYNAAQFDGGANAKAAVAALNAKKAAAKKAAATKVAKAKAAAVMASQKAAVKAAVAAKAQVTAVSDGVKNAAQASAGAAAKEAEVAQVAVEKAQIELTAATALPEQSASVISLPTDSSDAVDAGDVQASTDAAPTGSWFARYKRPLLWGGIAIGAVLLWRSRR